MASSRVAETLIETGYLEFHLKNINAVPRLDREERSLRVTGEDQRVLSELIWEISTLESLL